MKKKQPPFSLRLTFEERARLEELAGDEPLGSYIVDKDGAESFLDMEEFEVPHIREWVRDWITASQSASGASRLRSESRERIRILASILRAAFPEEAFMWGMRAANQNRPPKTEDAS